jgi:hypothetical protein
MPTPFTHLNIAQRLLCDDTISADRRELLNRYRRAFSLGSIAADARVDSGRPRDSSHFYTYGQRITEPPWRVMIRENPALMTPQNDAHKTFIAAYVAHLGADEYWSRVMVAPHFVEREWADRFTRFFILHILLIYMDERDEMTLEAWQAESLKNAEPDHWLAFISDSDLRRWRDIIYDQIRPEGVSQTVQILSERVAKQPQELRAFMNSPERMQAELWDHVSLETLKTIEVDMYDYARDQMLCYLDEANPG